MEGLEGRTPFEQLANWVCKMAKEYLQPMIEPHVTSRWIGTILILIIYVLKLASMRGFEGITCGLGLYVLNLIMGYTWPQVDPNKRGPNAFEPFIPLLPEFVFWYSTTIAICIAYLVSFFPQVDFPVTVPVCVCYGIIAIALLVYSVMRLGYYVSIKRSDSTNVEDKRK